MATRFTTEELIAFVSGDDDLGLSDSKTVRTVMELSMPIVEAGQLVRKTLDLLLEKLFLNKDQVPVMV